MEANTGGVGTEAKSGPYLNHIYKTHMFLNFVMQSADKISTVQAIAIKMMVVAGAAR